LLFVIIEAAGVLSQRYLGSFGFYAISLIGGIVSSTSAVASAAVLTTRGNIPHIVAANGAILASIASLLTDPVLVARVARNKTLTRRLTTTLILVALAGIAVAVIQTMVIGRTIGIH
jgi:uncharacterized membrane protein (DUF4010 family)